MIRNATLNTFCEIRVTTETALSRLDSASLQKVFAVNAFGPILVSKVRLIAFMHGLQVVRSLPRTGHVVQAFLPLLSKGGKDRYVAW